MNRPARTKEVIKDGSSGALGTGAECRRGDFGSHLRRLLTERAGEPRDT